MTSKEYSEVIERFIKYIKVDTESIPDREEFPSSEKQKKFAEQLVTELKEMGASDVKMDSYGYVYAEIPSTMKRKIAVPVLGFIAHMDTSCAVSGKDVKPQMIEQYDGTDICLNKELGYTLRVKDFPEITNYIGDDLIVTDGTTLLGADDKAGIAEIMTMADTLLKHPEIEHGTIKIAFTPDEEVGRGAEFFDVKGFGAEYAYTVDGGALGELEYENFNAASAKVSIHGKSIHPGSAKGQMRNAVLLAMEFQQMLPESETPAHTGGYEGFYHLDSIQGVVDHAAMNYIIRDHSKEKFQER